MHKLCWQPKISKLVTLDSFITYENITFARRLFDAREDDWIALTEHLKKSSLVIYIWIFVIA